MSFLGTSTGLPLDFGARSANSSFTYNDTEFSGSTFPILSVGDDIYIKNFRFGVDCD